MTEIDSIVALLAGEVGVRMVRKDKIDREEGKEALTPAQYAQIKPYVRHLVTTGNKDLGSLPASIKGVLDLDRQSQIRVRLASAFIAHESRLRSAELPIVRQDWFLELLGEKYLQREATSATAKA